MTAAGDGVTLPASLVGSDGSAEFARAREPEFVGPMLGAGNRGLNTHGHQGAMTLPNIQHRAPSLAFRAAAAALRSPMAAVRLSIFAS